jgi:hypothetical protein
MHIFYELIIDNFYVIKHIIIKLIPGNKISFRILRFDGFSYTTYAGSNCIRPFREHVSVGRVKIINMKSLYLFIRIKALVI